MSDPLSLDSIYGERDRWSRIHAAAQEELQSAARRVAHAEVVLEECSRRTGARAVADQIAVALAPRFPECVVEAIGPFGLGYHVAIYVTAGGRRLCRVQLQPDGADRLHLIDPADPDRQAPAGVGPAALDDIESALRQSAEQAG